MDFSINLIRQIPFYTVGTVVVILFALVRMNSAGAAGISRYVEQCNWLEYGMFEPQASLPDSSIAARHVAEIPCDEDLIRIRA